MTIGIDAFVSERIEGDIVGTLQHSVWIFVGINCVVVLWFDVLFQQTKSMSDAARSFVVGIEESVVINSLQRLRFAFQHGRVAIDVHNDVIIRCESGREIGREGVLNSADGFFEGDGGCG